MGPQTELLWEFVDRCGVHAEKASLISDFTAVLRAFGFNYFMMTGLPAYGEDVEDLVVCNHWPAEWTRRYREQSYFLDDPVARWSFSQAVQFTWRDARDRSARSSRTQAIEGEAAEFALVDGLGFPVLDPDNWQAIISVASDQPLDICRKTASVLYLAGIACHSRAAELLGKAESRTDVLTAREREVLTWAAAGKSYWETSEILSISRATVETHLLHARQKLDAVNTAQAIVRALRARQIHL